MMENAEDFGNNYIEQYFCSIKRECDKCGLKCENRFGTIHIFTIAEEFCFEPINGSNKITLYHRNALGCRQMREQYHMQFKNRPMNPKQIVDYIKKHTSDKYGTTKRKSRIEKCFQIIENQKIEKQILLSENM